MRAAGGKQHQIADARRNIEPGVGTDRNRLQSDRTGAAADQNVGAKPGPDAAESEQIRLPRARG